MPRAQRKTSAKKKDENEKFVSVDMYSLHEGTRGRDGGPYLDQVERQTQERVRQNVLNSEEEFNTDLTLPLAEQLETLPGCAGTPIVVESQRVDNSFSNPSSLRHVDDFSPVPIVTADLLKDQSAYSASTADVTGHLVIPHEPGDHVDASGEVTKWGERKVEVNDKAEVSATSQSLANPLNALVGDESVIAPKIGNETKVAGDVIAEEAENKNPEHLK